MKYFIEFVAILITLLIYIIIYIILVIIKFIWEFKFLSWKKYFDKILEPHKDRNLYELISYLCK